MIIIPRIFVTGANAQSAYSFVTGVSPLAWLGLARKLAIDINGLEGSEKVRISILHHHMEMKGENHYGDILPSQLRSAELTTRKQTQMSMGLQPIANCNLKATLIIDGINASSEKVKKHLLKLRLAGGAIESFGEIIQCEIDEILFKTKGGFFIKEFDCLSGIAPQDKIKAFLSLLLKTKDKNEEIEKNEDTKNKKWLSPMNLGYIAVTDFNEKENSRFSLPHAYAEPLVGMIEYVSKNKIEDFSQIPFWEYSNTIKNVFVAKPVVF